MKYYVGEDAEATADAIWIAAGTSLGTSQQGDTNGKGRGSSRRSAK